MSDKRVILVTGMPRSGTTWVGRVHASAPKSAYVLEPLNVVARLSRPTSPYNASVLWRLLHRAILHYREAHPNWIFLRHEDLSHDPIGQFTRVFSELDMPFTDRTEAFLESTSKGNHQDFIHQRTPTNIVARDTHSHVKVWKDRLTPEEIAQIRDLTKGVADEFYGDEGWE